VKTIPAPSNPLRFLELWIPNVTDRRDKGTVLFLRWVEKGFSYSAFFAPVLYRDFISPTLNDLS